MSHHQIQIPHVDSPDEQFSQNSDEKHFVATSSAAGYEPSPEAEIAQEHSFALATDQPNEDMFPDMENFDEVADFFDLFFGSTPIWNTAENDSTWCLEPGVGVNEAVILEASSPDSQISFDKLRRLLDQRKAQREAADGADNNLPMLSEEDYTDLYPMECTQEQWDQLMAEYPMVDVADLMVAQFNRRPRPLRSLDLLVTISGCHWK
ncbi:hypothetical protein E4U59_005536 [Claviceps monticola]|nr:hypothetical protein E4U59_005536 [Claviceps monticola]